jgi:hypothetical protein
LPSSFLGFPGGFKAERVLLLILLIELVALLDVGIAITLLTVNAV